MLCKLEGKQKWTMHKDDSTRGGVKYCFWHIKLGYRMQNLSRMCRNPRAQHLGFEKLEWILVPTVICYDLDHDTSSTVTYCTPWWPNHCCIEIEQQEGFDFWVYSAVCIKEWPDLVAGILNTQCSSMMLCKLEGNEKEARSSTTALDEWSLWNIKLGCWMQNLSKMYRDPQAQGLGFMGA